MIVACKYSEGVDKFLISNVSSLDELDTYIKENTPVKCMQLGRVTAKALYYEEEMKEKLVYFNNYLSISECKGYILSYRNADNLYDLQCGKCRYRDYFTTGCKYNPDKNMLCKTYEQKPEPFSIKEWIKNKIKIK
ncbi:hypothetical protein PQ478_09255 [Alkalihalophilus pseudofirmus]|uniref:hypothetical protein n=1 Tax=Alkalihalophilus pseudofirmus TaxID=79885 RepID=UPI00259BABBB|nr:hypothetical protein [Alkalihalophilus pseudofirmus]WEG18656.1 hypothetical protein PQ478_09255 [Alkalihalophilus pseudofirmus]